ncbi:MAG: NAD-binding protein [Thermoleophilaceae bacterium]|nr:NAD-binding protein [Thermoleophilaceae bacterium]
MEDPSPAGGPASPHILLISRDELTDVTQRALHAAGARVTYLRDPNDRDIRRALDQEVDAVVVIAEDDHISLRLALVVEGVRPGVRLIVTVYDRDVAAQLERVAGNVRVMSMPDIVAPTLAGPCFDDRLLSVSRTPEGFCGVQAGEEGPRLVPIEPYSPSPGQRLLVNLGSLLHPFESSARTLMAGLLGFLLILVLDTVATVIVLDESLVEGFYAATKTIVTVGPNSLVEEGPGWFKVFSAAVMLAALAFTAIFTAGVVNRLLAPRHVAMAGPRSLPRKDHVVVVGLGQVGLRLCLSLRELGVPVVAIESDPAGDYVARAKQYRVPVVVGQGGSRFLLRRLSLERARALAAVTSDEIANIAIVVGALGVREDLRTLLRAGRGDVVNETRSLFSIGVVRDVRRVGGTMLAAAALGEEGSEAFLHEQIVYLIAPDGRIEPFAGDVSSAREIAATSGEGDATSGEGAGSPDDG